MDVVTPTQTSGAEPRTVPTDVENPSLPDPRTTGESPATANALPSQGGTRRYNCFVVVHRLLGTHGEMYLSVHYPMGFRILVLLASTTSLWWVLNFFVSVLPATTEASDGPCRFSDDQLRQNAIVLFAYFVCFAVVRVFIFMPGVAARVAEIQSGTHGPWRLYALHMILHGPLYIFGIGSILFGFQLIMSPKCDADPQTPELHSIFRYYAGYSCLVFASCLVLAYSHSKIISQAAARQAENKRRAPPGTLDKLPTHSYDPEIFGDEDGKRYPGECPICLQEWEEGDTIKVTPCGHAFHADCIGHWLENERTCAFCRQDVTAPPCPSNRVIGASSLSSAAAPVASTVQAAPEGSDAVEMSSADAAATPAVIEDVNQLEVHVVSLDVTPDEVDGTPDEVPASGEEMPTTERSETGRPRTTPPPAVLAGDAAPDPPVEPEHDSPRDETPVEFTL